jgi:8-amino-7-oxononanoate synthase
MDLFDKCGAFTRAEEAMSADLYPYFTPIQEVYGNKVKVRGKEMIMVGSNNYLGLMEHPKVKKAAQEAIDRYGVATCGSRFLSGTMDIHEEMERRLARFTGKEAAQSVSTGFQTNQAIISTIAGKGDAIIADRLVHASIIDACRLSLAEAHKFKHNDMADLERVLKNLPLEQGKLVVVDGVFSM